MEILQIGNYKIINLTDGLLMTKAIKVINDRHAEGINFNYIKNFPSDIDDIKLAKDIKYIQINDYPWDFDYSAINGLQKLEHLSIYSVDKKEINFLNFPHLKSATINWRPKASSLFNCSNLQRLFIGKYNEPDLSRFKDFTELKYLRINTGSIKSLKGIERIQNLETLLLMQATKLEVLDGIEKLSNLRHLTIDNCRNIKNIDIVNQLNNLSTLRIGGTTPKLME